MTNLLYALEETNFEPRLIHYLPVRSDAIYIIGTQVAENSGKLVSFALEVTIW